MLLGTVFSTWKREMDNNLRCRQISSSRLDTYLDWLSTLTYKLIQIYLAQRYSTRGPQQRILWPATFRLYDCTCTRLLHQPQTITRRKCKRARVT